MTLERTAAEAPYLEALEEVLGVRERRREQRQKIALERDTHSTASV
jgi:hypothetical protein